MGSSVIKVNHVPKERLGLTVDGLQEEITLFGFWSTDNQIYSKLKDSNLPVLFTVIKCCFPAMEICSFYMPEPEMQRHRGFQGNSRQQPGVAYLTYATPLR